MAALTYVTDTGGDWAALYINGTLAEGVQQNHSLDLYGLLEGLVGTTIDSVGHFEADMEEGMADWLGDRGFPYNLNEIPQEARS